LHILQLFIQTAAVVDAGNDTINNSLSMSLDGNKDNDKMSVDDNNHCVGVLDAVESIVLC
jgi:hypothetical protein